VRWIRDQVKSTQFTTVPAMCEVRLNQNHQL
jgi:hypothetical protein